MDLIRLQQASRNVGYLKSIVDQMTLADSRIAVGSNVRIAKVVTTGTHPTTGQTFEIQFDNGMYTESGGSTPSYIQRHPDESWCCNVLNYIPALGDFILVWRIDGQWWTKCGQSSQTEWETIDPDTPGITWQTFADDVQLFQLSAGGQVEHTVGSTTPSLSGQLGPAFRPPPAPGSIDGVDVIFSEWAKSFTTVQSSTNMYLRVTAYSDGTYGSTSVAMDHLVDVTLSTNPAVGQVPENVLNTLGGASFSQPAGQSNVFAWDITHLHAALVGNHGYVWIREDPQQISGSGDRFHGMDIAFGFD